MLLPALAFAAAPLPSSFAQDAPDVSAPPVAIEAAGPPALEGVAVGAVDGQLVVTMPLVSEVEAFPLDDPPRVVIDVVATSRLPGAPGTQRHRLDAWGVRAMRTSQFAPGPERPVTRIVLDLDAGELPVAGDAPRVRVSTHRTFSRVLVLGRIEQEGRPVVFGTVGDRTLSDAYGLPFDRSPDTPERGMTLPDDPREAKKAIEDARASINYDPEIASPSVSTDPTEAMIVERRGRLWDRRAEELVVDARLRHAAGDYRRGLANLHKVLRFYAGSRHVHEAHAVAAALYADVRFDHEALSHAEMVLAAEEAPDSLCARVVEIAAAAEVRAVVWQQMVRVHALANERLGDTQAVRRLGGRAGILLAESGEQIDEAIALIRRALQDEPASTWAADLHEGFAACHHAQQEPGSAARQHFFAAQLLRSEDPVRSIALRLRAADAYFEADDLPRAGEQYALVAELSEAPDELKAWSLFQLGNCHFRTRAFVNAAHAYRRLSEAYPSSFWAKQIASRLAVLERARARP